MTERKSTQRPRAHSRNACIVIENVISVFFVAPNTFCVSVFSTSSVINLPITWCRYHPGKIVVFSVVYTTIILLFCRRLHYSKKTIVYNMYIEFNFFICKKTHAIGFDHLIAVVIDFATYLTPQLLRNV